jgi:hypothetical protein
MHLYKNNPTQAAKSVRPQPLYTDAIFKMQVTFEQNLDFFRRLASSLVWPAFETTKLAIEGMQFGHFQLFGNRSIGLVKLRLMIARCLTKD